VEAGRNFELLSQRSKDYGLAGQPMKKFRYVYILVSEEDAALHYSGITENLKERLAMHNRGKCPNTSTHRPWRIETAIAFSSESKARAFEKYLKSGSGREFARRYL
jgi:predicted GIY-YIG superfamily endonuclease